MRGRTWVCLILVLYGSLGVGYSLVMPMWEAPDEAQHYLRILDEAELLPTPLSNPQAPQPRPYYWLASRLVLLLFEADPALVRPVIPQPRSGSRQRMASRKSSVVPFRPQVLRDPVPWFPWSAEGYRFVFGVYLLRWLNLAIGGTAVYLIFRSCQQFAPRSPSIVLATTLLVASMPQFLHLTASVSNEPLGYLAGAYLFLLLSKVCTDNLRSGQRCLVVMAAVCLPILTKVTVLPMSLAVLLALFWQAATGLRTRPRRELGWSLLLSAFVLTALVLFAPEAVRPLWSNALVRLSAIRPGALDGAFDHFVVFATSFWGLLGWMEVGLPRTLVIILTELSCLGALASGSLFIPRVKARLLPGDHDVVPEGGFAWVMVWAAAALAVLAVVKNFLATYWGIQARHLFPSLGALSLIIVSGWFVLLPPRARPWLPYLVVASMLCLNLVIWFGMAIPIYHQPFLD